MDVRPSPEGIVSAPRSRASFDPCAPRYRPTNSSIGSVVPRLKIRLAIRHTYNEPAGQRDEVGRCQAEDGVWRPGGGPVVVEAQQALIDATTGSRLTAKRTSGRGRVSAGHMHQHLGRGRRAGLLAAKPELRYWAMPLAGSPRAIPSSNRTSGSAPSGLPNTERPKLSRGSLSHLREPERRPDALAFGKI
jgi:hypothetical protein